MMTLFYVLIALLGVSFAALNASSVLVSFYFMKVSMPVSILMMLTFGVGIMVGFIISLLRYYRLKSETRRLKNQLKITQREIKNLRTIPVTDNYAGFGDR